MKLKLTKEEVMDLLYLLHNEPDYSEREASKRDKLFHKLVRQGELENEYLWETPIMWADDDPR